MQNVLIPLHLNTSISHMQEEMVGCFEQCVDLQEGPRFFCLSAFTTEKTSGPRVSSSMCFPCSHMVFGSIDILCIIIILSWQTRQIFALQKRSKRSHLQILYESRTRVNRAEWIRQRIRIRRAGFLRQDLASGWCQRDSGEKLFHSWKLLEFSKLSGQTFRSHLGTLLSSVSARATNLNLVCTLLC